jgi:hypothetical protein
MLPLLDYDLMALSRSPSKILSGFQLLVVFSFYLLARTKLACPITAFPVALVRL